MPTAKISEEKEPTKISKEKEHTKISKKKETLQAVPATISCDVYYYTPGNRSFQRTYRYGL
jgi:hypothetical protein